MSIIYYGGLVSLIYLLKILAEIKINIKNENKFKWNILEAADFNTVFLTPCLPLSHPLFY
jgi:hypothetical protein